MTTVSGRACRPRRGHSPAAAEPVEPGGRAVRGAVLQRPQAIQPSAHRGVSTRCPSGQGKSIVNSHWIKDMIGFYGLDIFLAETSATCGGLDSLLAPTGPLRDAQQLAAEAFGSARGRPTSSPTAPRPPTGSSARRWCSPATSCWSTATATSPTITGRCSPARTSSTWTPTAERVLDVRRGPAPRAQTATAGAAGGGQARPGQGDHADQPHVRRRRVRRRAGQAECLSAIAATPTAATLQVTADAELRVS